MSADDTLLATTVERPNDSTSTAAVVTSSLLADDVTDSGGDHVTKSTKSHSVQIREPPVSDTHSEPRHQTTTTAVVFTKQKHGPLHRAIPSMPLPVAVIACILNIILPGTGRRRNVVLCIIYRVAPKSKP